MNRELLKNIQTRHINPQVQSDSYYLRQNTSTEISDMQTIGSLGLMSCIVVILISKMLGQHKESKSNQKYLRKI